MDELTVAEQALDWLIRNQTLIIRTAQAICIVFGGAQCWLWYARWKTNRKEPDEI